MLLLYSPEIWGIYGLTLVDHNPLNLNGVTNHV
uniref:Uncharacterized protein n=1 Tax=Salmonella phage PMBT31 TaxID=3153514 RepID=A0AAU8GLL1_9CAUD